MVTVTHKDVCEEDQEHKGFGEHLDEKADAVSIETDFPK